MLGRAATRIELNRDSDLSELVEARHEFELRNQQRHQQPFGNQSLLSKGQAPFSGTHVHSIFAGGDSSSSGLASGFMDASNSGIMADA